MYVKLNPPKISKYGEVCIQTFNKPSKKTCAMAFSHMILNLPSASDVLTDRMLFSDILWINKKKLVTVVRHQGKFILHFFLMFQTDVKSIRIMNEVGKKKQWRSVQNKSLSKQVMRSASTSLTAYALKIYFSIQKCVYIYDDRLINRAFATLPSSTVPDVCAERRKRKRHPLPLRCCRLFAVGFGDNLLLFNWLDMNADRGTLFTRSEWFAHLNLSVVSTNDDARQEEHDVQDGSLTSC